MKSNRVFTRRDFLRDIGMVGAGAATVGPSNRLYAASAYQPRKTVVVTFGGGARDEETFAPQGQENIPNLIGSLIPQATFCTQVVNRGILGHYVATASLATGVYETFNNFAATAPRNPTVFEYHREHSHRPENDAWVIAPSNGFNKIGQSDGSRIAPGWGAQVILPKALLAQSVATHGLMQSAPGYALQDNFENPFEAFSPQSNETQQALLAELSNLSAEEFMRHAHSLVSADELSVFVLRNVMRRFSPSLIWITLHDMDVAHTGAFSLYVDAIRRTDKLCADIWQMIQGDAEYKDRTTMLILPDFGRDSDFDVSGNGFQHHRTGDALSRTTWMMALGPHIRQNTTVDRQLDSLDLAPTIGSLMGFQARYSKGHPIGELI